MREVMWTARDESAQFLECYRTCHKVKLTCYPDYCGQAESDSSHTDNNISVHPVKTTLDTWERIHVTTMISMQLAEAAKEDTPTAKLKEMLPKPYLSFQTYSLRSLSMSYQNGNNETM